MSRAFKCDRCKKCFDPFGLSGGKEFTRISEYCYATSEDYKNTVASYRDHDIHLCATCTDHFKKFMAKEPYAKYASPIRDVIHADEKEKKQAFEDGFKAGMSYKFDLPKICKAYLDSE